MSALFIGFMVVIVSAALFGFALFGRRPLPQPAMAGVGTYGRVSAGAEMTPSRYPSGQVTVAHISGVDSPVIVQAPDEPAHLSSADVRVSLPRRIRSAVLLAFSVFGAAVLVGVVLSILVVGAVLVVA